MLKSRTRSLLPKIMWSYQDSESVVLVYAGTPQGPHRYEPRCPERSWMADESHGLLLEWIKNNLGKFLGKYQSNMADI